MIMMFQMQIHGKSHAHNANVLVNLVCLSIDESVLKWFCWGRHLVEFNRGVPCRVDLQIFLGGGQVFARGISGMIKAITWTEATLSIELRGVCNMCCF